MSRQPWTQAELDDLHLGWKHFHELWPNRSYDSWEVKRRRVHGPLANGRAYGTKQADQLAEKVLKVLEEYLATRRG